MKDNNFRRIFILFAAQIFVALVYFVALDLLFRWNSLVYQADVNNIMYTAFTLSVLSFAAAGAISMLFSVLIMLIRKARVQLVPFGVKALCFLIFLFVSHINFLFLKLWVNKTIPAQFFDRDDRIISMITFFWNSAPVFGFSLFCFSKTG